MNKPVALITNALAFAGPPAVAALRNAGFQIVVHDAAFVASDVLDTYRSANPDVMVLAEQTPAAIVEIAWSLSNRLDVLVAQLANGRSKTLSELDVELDCSNSIFV